MYHKYVQRSHIFKINLKIEGYLLYVSLKNYSLNMLVAWTSWLLSSEKPLHSIMAYYCSLLILAPCWQTAVCGKYNSPAFQKPWNLKIRHFSWPWARGIIQSIFIVQHAWWRSAVAELNSARLGRWKVLGRKRAEPATKSKANVSTTTQNWLYLHAQVQENAEFLDIRAFEMLRSNISRTGRIS
jgi:hypothetical protein